MPSRRLPVPAHAETTAVGVTGMARIFAHVARAVTCLDYRICSVMAAISDSATN